MHYDLKCKKLNLLVIDDDKQLIKFFKIYFTRIFANVFVLENASHALELIQKHRIDIILSDYEMPRYNGMWLLRELEKKNIEIPVLMISGAPLRKNVEITIQKLAHKYMRKPIDIQTLHSVIMSGVQYRIHQKEKNISFIKTHQQKSESKNNKDVQLVSKKTA